MKAAPRLALLVGLVAFAGLASAERCNVNKPLCPQFSCPPAGNPDATSCSSYTCGSVDDDDYYYSDDDYHYNDDDYHYNDDDYRYNDDDYRYDDDDYNQHGCDVACCDPATKNLVTIIVGAAVGAFVLLVVLPLCYCFWAGVACCAACRRRSGSVTVHHHQQVTYRPMQNQVVQPHAQSPHPYLNSANPPQGYAAQHQPQHAQAKPTPAQAMPPQQPQPAMYPPPQQQQAPPPYMGAPQHKQ